MRLSSTSLLLAGALAAGVSMVNCSANDGSTDDAVAADTAAVTAIGNPLGLKLRYDDKSSTVRASMHRQLEQGEVLRLQVRRGRLSARSQLQLDCSRLPVASAIPMTFENQVYSMVAGVPSVTYQGPLVDPSLLATVYSEQWILDHVTPKMLQELETQGADSIVEACVMNGSAIGARVQTSIAYAWDMADPLLASAPSGQTIETALRVAHIKTCAANETAPGCAWADVPEK